MNGIMKKVFARPPGFIFKNCPRLWHYWRKCIIKSKTGSKCRKTAIFSFLILSIYWVTYLIWFRSCFLHHWEGGSFDLRWSKNSFSWKCPRVPLLTVVKKTLLFLSTPSLVSDKMAIRYVDELWLVHLAKLRIALKKIILFYLDDSWIFSRSLRSIGK